MVSKEILLFVSAERVGMSFFLYEEWVRLRLLPWLVSERPQTDSLASEVCGPFACWDKQRMLKEESND